MNLFRIILFVLLASLLIHWSLNRTPEITVAPQQYPVSSTTNTSLQLSDIQNKAIGKDKYGNMNILLSFKEPVTCIDVMKFLDLSDTQTSMYIMEHTCYDTNDVPAIEPTQVLIVSIKYIRI